MTVIHNPARAEFGQSFSYCISEIAMNRHLTDFQALNVTFQPEINTLRHKWQVVKLRLELPRKKAPGYSGLKHGSLSLPAVWPP